MTKTAQTDHPIQPALAERWSPYAFEDRDVTEDDLRSLFEAARWAPSSYNEQPWSYVLASRKRADEFERLASCLNEANRAWASHAPVLALGITRHSFSRNDKSNAAAEHDLGLATSNLLHEATVRGLSVHQMIGILPDRARDLYAIPEHSHALTAIAIGYVGDAGMLSESLREREQSLRTRKPLADFVFGATYGQPSSIAKA